MDSADALAAGRQPTTPAQQSPAAPSAPFARDIQRRLDQAIQRADEALHRSEMALQQVRRLASQLSSLAEEGQSRVARAELNPLIERVKLLGRELAEQRNARRPVAESTPIPRDLHALIDQRVKDRLAAVERTRTETDRLVEATLDTNRGARPMGLWALVCVLVALRLGGAALWMVLGG